MALPPTAEARESQRLKASTNKIRFNQKGTVAMHYTIGVDLGGTHLRAVRLDRDGQIHAHQRVATAAMDGPAAVIAQIERLIAHVVRDIDHSAIIGVGVASPGPVDLDAGI